MLLGSIAGGVLGWVLPIVIAPLVVFGRPVLLSYLIVVIPASVVFGAVLFGCYRAGAAAAVRAGAESRTVERVGLSSATALAVVAIVAAAAAPDLLTVPMLLWLTLGTSVGCIVGGAWALALPVKPVVPVLSRESD
jgi:hypothetical protein